MDFEAFFADYNVAISEVSERDFESRLEELSETMSEAALLAYYQRCVEQGLQMWYQQAQPSLDGQSFLDTVEKLSDEDFLDFVKAAAQVLETSIPKPMASRLARLREQNPELFETLRQDLLRWTFAEEAQPTDHEAPPRAEQLGALSLSLLLVEWQDLNFAERFVVEEAKRQELSEFSAQIGHQLALALGPAIAEQLNEAVYCQLEQRQYGTALEYLLIQMIAAHFSSEERANLTTEALAEVLRQRNESATPAQRQRAYELLRRAFREMPHKQIAVICLGDFADPRAIVLLRSWLERHAGQVDKPLFLEICSTVSRLGGETEDLLRYAPAGCFDQT